tara:strand:- start:2268 stop:2855 length:588 start_codon:yes stop_codon:yes gene_type:complete
MKTISKIYFIYIFLLFNSFSVYCQDIIIKDFIVEDGDTILIDEIPSLEIIIFKDDLERRKYLILKRKVLKVYPYALYTKNKLEEIELDLKKIKRKYRKKRYTKRVSVFLKKELGEELKKLTRTEGNILVKLIYRETNISTYKLLKKYRGNLNAFFWQTMAKIYDNDLKQEYDPVNNREDMFIEHIIIQSKLQGKL